MRKSLRFVSVAATLFVATSLALRADVTADADLQFQLGSLLFEETRYREAIDAFDRAIRGGDPALTVRARKGKVRAALRIAEFGIAQIGRASCRNECRSRRKARFSNTET